MPAVFVHGVPDTAAMWKPLLAELEREDVVTLALPGFRAPLPEGFGSTMEEYADWVAAQVASIEGPVDLVGHDWGSLLTERIALTRPELLRSFVMSNAAVTDAFTWHDLAVSWQTPEVGEQIMELMTPDAVAVALQDAGHPDAQGAGDAVDDTMKRCILALYRSAIDIARGGPPPVRRSDPAWSSGASTTRTRPRVPRRASRRRPARSSCSSTPAIGPSHNDRARPPPRCSRSGTASGESQTAVRRPRTHACHALAPMTVAPELQPYVAAVSTAEMPALSELPIEQVRDQAELFAHVGAKDPEPVDVVEDRTIPGPAGEIPVRVYDPDPGSTSPVVAYFHGGGFVMMGLDTHDRVCRRLANATGAVVVSVDYRLAPEHRFPAALDDCMAVIHWLTAHAAELAGDPTRIAVAGDSAGGNLAAATALAARNGGPGLVGQVLVYPVLDAAVPHGVVHDQRRRVPAHREHDAMVLVGVPRSRR